MKLRIKGDSIRLRLSKTDLKTLEENKPVTETTSFGEAILQYELVPSDKYESLNAVFQNNKITVFIPASFSVLWNANDIISIDAEKDLDNNKMLYIIVEKDFQCLDKTTEDQSDFFTNPSKTCQ